MIEAAPTNQSPRSAAALIRHRIEAGGERLWRMDDFRELPFLAVAQALSRLAKRGVVERLSKGIYYRARQTTLGSSRPSPASLRQLVSPRHKVFPAGLAAANLLGFTTQSGPKLELATSGLSLPRKLVGRDTVIHIRRPEAWAGLTEIEAALLDFLRRGGNLTELSPEETTRKVLVLLAVPGRFERLLKVAHTEPPRVRAILGAIGEELGLAPRALRQLRATLNPISRFAFGALNVLPNARIWQAKEQFP
jgi:hypothetical protein